MSILFLSMSRYPKGGADSVRLGNMIKIFRHIDEDIYVVSRAESTSFSFHEYDNVPYISFRHESSGIITKIFDIFRYTEYLKKYVLPIKKWDTIFIENVPVSTVKFIKKYALQYNIKLIYDCVEWYSKEEFKLGRLSLSYNINRKWLTKFIDQQFRVIAISTFLENYFKSRGINTVRIPVTMDMSSISCEKEKKTDKLVLLYAGSPGRKDSLNVIIDGIMLLTDEYKDKLELRIIGTTWRQLNKIYHYKTQYIEQANKCIKVLGRVDRETVLQHLKETDFTVLMRPENLRYAQAGFPTKVVESLASGTPVITNLTSDLGLYLVDGENSVIVKECTKEAFADAVRRAMLINSDKMNKVIKNARYLAENVFENSKYIIKLSSLIQS